MATWARATRLVACHRLACGIEIPAGEVVCLVSTAQIPTCQRCAATAFGLTAPELPALVRPRPVVATQQHLTLSDSSEPPARDWAVARKAKGELTRRQLREANAIDPKLAQLGGDR